MHIALSPIIHASIRQQAAGILQSTDCNQITLKDWDGSGLRVVTAIPQ